MKINYSKFIVYVIFGYMLTSNMKITESHVKDNNGKYTIFAHLPNILVPDEGFSSCTLPNPNQKVNTDNITVPTLTSTKSIAHRRNLAT